MLQKEMISCSEKFSCIHVIMFMKFLTFASSML